MIGFLKGIGIAMALMVLLLIAAMLGAPAPEEMEAERAAATATRTAQAEENRVQSELSRQALRIKIENCAFTDEEIFQKVRSSIRRQLFDPRSARWDTPEIAKEAEKCQWRIDGFVRAKNDNGLFITVGYGAVVIDGMVVAAGLK